MWVRVNNCFSMSTFVYSFRSILTTPWVELGGKITVSCAKTGYNSTVDFLTKPFYGGKKHKISGNIYAPNEKKPICVLDGEWNDIVWARHDTGVNSFILSYVQYTVKLV